MTLSITAVGWVAPGWDRWECFTDPLTQANSSAGGEWFDANHHLGKRGHKYFSNASRYLLAAACRAVGINDTRSEDLKERTGVIIGTNQADYWVRRDVDAIVLRHGANALNAIEAPNTAVNLPASQVAMRFGYTGPNLTLTNPHLAGLEAIYVADRLLRRHRLSAVMSGAVEDSFESGYSTGGAGVLLLEKSSEVSRPALARIEEIDLDFHAYSDHALSERIVAKLRQKCKGGYPVWLISHCPELAQRTQSELQSRLHVPVNDLSKTNESFPAKHTMLPLMQLLWLLANRHEGVVLAQSNLGNIIMFTLTPAKEEKP